MFENPDTEYIIRNQQAFGRALCEFRSRQGITQAELADMTSLHRSYLSALECGANTEAIRRLVVIARALDLEIVIRPRQRVS
ncbi:MAG: helix-turn-helix domain-containing protein [Ferrimicrobium sp.]